MIMHVFADLTFMIEFFNHGKAFFVHKKRPSLRTASSWS